MIDEACANLFSESTHEWIDVKKILKTLRNYGLTEEEAASILDFLAKYFLELDSLGKRARPLPGFRHLYEKE